MTNEELNDNIWNALEKERIAHEQRLTDLTNFLIEQEQERNNFLQTAFNTQNKHLQAILKKLEEPQPNDKTNKLQEQLQKILQVELQRGFMNLQQATEQSFQGFIDLLGQEFIKQEKRDSKIQRILYEDDEY